MRKTIRLLGVGGGCLFLSGCARLFLGNEIVNEMTAAAKDMRRDVEAVATDTHGLLFVALKFAEKNGRWPKDEEELKRFWSNPANLTDRSACSNLKVKSTAEGGMELTWMDTEGSEKSISMGRVTKK